MADTAAVAADALGTLRLHLRDRFDLAAGAAHDLHWVVDFPLFGWNADEERWDALHHPFTAPRADQADAFARGEIEPGELASRGYDLVLDGSEIGGGSVRINRPEVQQAVFDALGIDAEEAEGRFGFLLRALRQGAPPHGGIAMGIDRIAAIVAGRDSIREVIAFPKTASGADPLTGAPAPVDADQLKALGLRSVASPGSATPG